VLTEEELARRTAKRQPTDQPNEEGKTSGQMLWEALRPAREDCVDYDFPRVNWTPRRVDL
jgi:hypothetical protein